MRKAMNDDAARNDNVAKRTKTATNVVKMSFFTRLLALVHVISGGRQPQTKSPSSACSQGSKECADKGDLLELQPRMWGCFH